MANIIKTTLEDANDVLTYNNRASFPSSGESGKLYIAADTKYTYFWNGSSYVETRGSGYASSGHTHDDRYYTESEINTKLNGKANSSDLDNYVTTDTSQTISASKTFTANNSFIGESKFSNDSYCPENSIADIANGIGKSSLFARSATMQTIAGQIMAPNSNGINDTYGYATEAGKIKLQYIASNSASQVNGSDIAVFSRDNIFFTSTNRPIWNNYMLALSNETGTGTIKVRQNGTSKGSFKLNDSTSQTIDFTDTTYSAGTGLSLNSNNNTFSIKTGYTTDANKRNYKVAADSNGNLYVNVPWSSSGTLDTSLSSTSTNALQNKAIYSALASAVGFVADYYYFGGSYGSWRIKENNNNAHSLDIRYGTITINSQSSNYNASFKKNGYFPFAASINITSYLSFNVGSISTASPNKMFIFSSTSALFIFSLA